MNLTLQSLNAERSTVDRIALMVGAPAIDIGDADHYAWRCRGISYSEALKVELDRICYEAGIDYAFSAPSAALSDFKLLAMDMDSTLITIECIDEIADMQGLKPQVAAITEAAMRGELEFDESLIQRVALLKGLDASALQRVYDERVQLSPGAENMLTAIKAAGLKTLLVSGGFTFFTDRIKTRLGLDVTHANELEIVDGKLTGKVLGGIVNAEEKKLTVQRVCADLGISPAQAIVMGDGANDLKMMDIAGLSVAFRAKPIVRAQAGVALNFVGLDGILPIFA
ncbi:phosphoserine phosphatase SerB [Paraherbaspirillum soli]|uniref:Phosphoserine phosphatase n=1 Tax=Paraherbaspirillum soli TaxID=631222 RepID=A0ABW0M9C1_9BURK